MLTMQIGGKQLDSEQRYDYAFNLAEMQAKRDIEQQEKKLGVLPEKWRKMMLNDKASILIQDFLRAHWGEYGYDEKVELNHLKDGLTDEQGMQAIELALEGNE